MKLVVLLGLVCLVAADDLKGLSTHLSTLDKDGDGVLEKSDLPPEARKISDAQWRLMVCFYDNNLDNKTQISEVVDFYRKFQEQDNSFIPEVLKKCVDKDEDEILDKSEYEAIEPSPLEWTLAICLLDKNPEDKKLQISEFEGIWAKLSQENLKNCENSTSTENSGVPSAAASRALPRSSSEAVMQVMPAMQALQSMPSAGCSVSINMILFSLASLMAMIWN